MSNSLSFRDVTSLLDRYGFESGGQLMEELVEEWVQHYPCQWVRLAAIEALYQGRYKTVSVGQILASWKRRGHALYHFNREFERLVSRTVPPKQPLLPTALNSSRGSELAIAPASSYLADDSSLYPEPPPNLAKVSAEFDPAASGETIEQTEQYLPDYAEEATSPPIYPEFNSLERSPSYEVSLEELNKRTIDRFTPKSDRSDVYFKLMSLSAQR